MEARFGHDFADVRVHTHRNAAESARSLGAAAYTVGRDIVFAGGAYAPNTLTGRHLLAHELAHVVQQDRALRSESTMMSRQEPLERAAEQAAVAVTSSADVGALDSPAAVPALQRQVSATPSPAVRSPLFEELVTQVSTVEAGAHGRPLRPDEVALARPIFGRSIDYSRVRLIPGPILEYRTVANTIRIPSNFTIGDPYMAQTLIHELTHVWQYQQGGTAYISISLGTQLAGFIRTGSRNVAYDYTISAGASFFDFTPEQQGLIVENYFSMLRDQKVPATGGPFYSNHFDPQGNYRLLTWAARQAEIARELLLHVPLIAQMQAALPRPEAQLVIDRAREVMKTPEGGVTTVPEQRQLTPVKPLLEVRF
jgi:hypothetical protein